ncbi:helix-turn-helix domain-containing protein [Halomonas sp. THAF12]|uniref:helix-turn-helix domain-containing protein n=1 Tax=Halomonas sp. B23F22_10 TaxID=3459515 RepID=UPI00373E0652
MPRVAILAYDGSALFELGCAVELFALPRPEFDDWYQTQVISFDAGMLAATADIRLQVDTVEHLEGFDMLVVPSWPVEVRPDERLVQEARRLHARGGTLISFCSGAFFLAWSGLLEARQATTHWRYAERFASTFPDVAYVEDVLYVYQDRIGCSAGSSAGLDLGIAVIRDHFGHAVANRVARRLVMAAHRTGGQSQYVETPVAPRPGTFAATLDWAIEHLAHDLDVNTLAEHARMSRRTFDRRFKASLGMSPHRWLTLQRVRLAQQLLEASNAPIEQVATLSGFANAVTLRHHFRQSLGQSPRQYRQRFGTCPDEGKENTAASPDNELASNDKPRAARAARRGALRS